MALLCRVIGVWSLLSCCPLHHCQGVAFVSLGQGVTGTGLPSSPGEGEVEGEQLFSLKDATWKLLLSSPRIGKNLAKVLSPSCRWVWGR